MVHYGNEREHKRSKFIKVDHPRQFYNYLSRIKCCLPLKLGVVKIHFSVAEVTCSISGYFFRE